MEPIIGEEDFKYHLGRLYFQENDYKEAIKIYREGLAINPQDIILLYEIGLAYLELGNNRRAKHYWKKLLEVAPHSLLAVEVERKFMK